MAKYKSRHKGSEIDNAVDKVESLATVATTGSYKDLADKPDIPSGGGADITVDESLSTTSTNPVQNKVITAELNKKGTYTKPSGGIPKSELASDVQESLGKADTALQSYEEQYKGTVTSVKIYGSTKNPNADGLVDLGNIVGGEGGSVIVDEALSDTSTNPVQNKAIAEALNQKFDKTGGRVDGSILVVPIDIQAIKFPSGEFIDRYGNIRLALVSATWGIYSGNGVELLKLNNSGGCVLSGSIKANDYLDAYGISLYETFATKVGTMAYEDSYIADANSWVTNGWVKTSATTINLPAQSPRKWGTLCTIYENTNNGSKVQIWIPVDGSHKGRMFTRAASDQGFSEWHLLATSAELGDINAVLDAINGEVI